MSEAETTEVETPPGDAPGGIEEVVTPLLDEPGSDQVLEEQGVFVDVQRQTDESVAETTAEDHLTEDQEPSDDEPELPEETP